MLWPNAFGQCELYFFAYWWKRDIGFGTLCGLYDFDPRLCCYYSSVNFVYVREPTAVSFVISITELFGWTPPAKSRDEVALKCERNPLACLTAYYWCNDRDITSSINTEKNGIVESTLHGFHIRQSNADSSIHNSAIIHYWMETTVEDSRQIFVKIFQACLIRQFKHLHLSADDKFGSRLRGKMISC